MIDYSLFTKDDLGVLLEGFETAFLQQPFKHPSKTIARLVPRGFRADKLNRQQIVKVFTDAILKREKSICSFVTTEIETQFKTASITSFIESHIENPDYLLGAGIITVSSLLWKNQLHIPAYIVYLLFGIEPSDTCKTESMLLFKTYFDELEKYGQRKFDEGVQNAERKSRSSIEAEARRADRLERSLSLAREQKDEAIAKCDVAYTERDEALSLAEARAKRMAESQGTIDRLEKELTQALYSVKLGEEKQQELFDVKSRLSEKQSECIEKDKQITALKTELSKAMDMAYTEEVLEHLCAEVLDELNAISLGSKEVLRIAKQRFSDEDTVLAGWESLSEESNKLIGQIVDQFSSGAFSVGQLDLLEKVEDGILIRFAVTKALKAILYNALEKQEAEATIGERFGGNGNV